MYRSKKPRIKIPDGSEYGDESVGSKSVGAKSPMG